MQNPEAYLITVVYNIHMTDFISITNNIELTSLKKPICEYYLAWNLNFQVNTSVIIQIKCQKKM